MRWANSTGKSPNSPKTIPPTQARRRPRRYISSSHLMDKRMSLQESVALLPAGDACLGLGGFTLYRRPMAFTLALLASLGPSGSRRALTPLTLTAGLESEILVGAGV